MNFKFGTKFKYKGKKYFVTKAGARVLEVRQVYDDPLYSGGRLGNALTKIKRSEL